MALLSSAVDSLCALLSVDGDVPSSVIDTFREEIDRSDLRTAAAVDARRVYDDRYGG